MMIEALLFGLGLVAFALGYFWVKSGRHIPEFF